MSLYVSSLSSSLLYIIGLIIVGSPFCFFCSIVLFCVSFSVLFGVSFGVFLFLLADVLFFCSVVSFAPLVSLASSVPGINLFGGFVCLVLDLVPPPPSILFIIFFLFGNKLKSKSLKLLLSYTLRLLIRFSLLI
jgi:hypothetical protein